MFRALTVVTLALAFVVIVVGAYVRLSDAGLAPRILRVGLPDRYVTHGSPSLLHAEVGFTGERIAERIEAAIAHRSGVTST